MHKTEAKEKKNLLVELAKRKAAAQASGTRVDILGKDLSIRFSQIKGVPSYAKRGGRNGSGKP